MTREEIIRLSVEAGLHDPRTAESIVPFLERFAALVAKHTDPMNEMWEALEKYQPYADKHGFGAEWKRMTTERTVEAAEHAHEASPNVYMEGTDLAGLAAIDATMAIYFYNQNQMEDAKSRAQPIIDIINEAIELEKNELKSVNETSNVVRTNKMNNIETGVTLDIYADPEYFYEIRVGEEYTLTYKETRSDQLDRKVYIGFASLEEMEAVAKAMLRAVKTAREMKEDSR